MQKTAQKPAVMNNAFFLIALLSFTSCTQNRRTIESPEQKAPAIQQTGNNSQNGTSNSTGSQNSGSQNGSISGGGGASVLVSKSLFKDAPVTSKFSYHVTYAGAVRDGELNFVGGSATINLTDLPAGKSGDFVLELLENGVVKYRGNTVTTLTVGAANNINIAINPVAGTTNATINITIAPTVSPTPSVPLPQTSWDGKQSTGNATWGVTVLN